MGIKFDKKGKKGDQKVVIICGCNNPAEADNQRQAYAKEIVEGGKPTIPQGSHLVSSRAIFLRPDSQQADKNLFLLQVTHPSINQNTPEELMKSAAQALSDIKERLKMEELSHATEVDSNYINKYLFSAPVPSAPSNEEIIKQEQEQGAVGSALPFDTGDKIPGAEGDQGTWKIPTLPALKEKVDKTGHMIIIYKNKNTQNK